jgi:hypothetical protein
MTLRASWPHTGRGRSPSPRPEEEEQEVENDLSVLVYPIQSENPPYMAEAEFMLSVDNADIVARGSSEDSLKEAIVDAVRKLRHALALVDITGKLVWGFSEMDLREDSDYSEEEIAAILEATGSLPPEELRLTQQDVARAYEKEDRLRGELLQVSRPFSVHLALARLFGGFWLPLSSSRAQPVVFEEEAAKERRMCVVE